MKNQTCCFSGHRVIPTEKIPAIQKHLEDEIVKLIHQGVIYYMAGGAIGFDTISALTVLKLKENFPYIKLILALPCKEQTRGWNKSDAETYNAILSQADKAVYVSENYFNGCMQKRNRHLADNSGYCICYLTKNNGGTKYTVDYAVRKGVEVINLDTKKT